MLIFITLDFSAGLIAGRYTVEFLKEKSRDSMLFPRAVDSISVNITLPQLAWLPAENASAYRVEIDKESVGTIYKLNFKPSISVRLA